MNVDEKSKFERMELSIIKIEKNVDNILNALIGNDINGNKGLIHKVQSLELELEELKKELIKLKDENTHKRSIFDIIKWFGAGIGGAIISYIVTQV